MSALHTTLGSFLTLKRVIRNRDVFENILLPELDKCMINIWSIRDRCGSLTHRDRFLGKIISAQDAAENMSFRAKTRSFNRGLENSEHSPTSASSGWSTREDERLKDFVDATKIPEKYQEMRRGKKAVNWTKLAEEFPYRTGTKLRDRVQRLRNRSKCLG